MGFVESRFFQKKMGGTHNENCGFGNTSMQTKLFSIDTSLGVVCALPVVEKRKLYLKFALVGVLNGTSLDFARGLPVGWMFIASYRRCGRSQN